MPRRRFRAGPGIVLAALVSLLAFVAVYYEPDPGEDAPRVLVSVDRSMWNTLGLNRLTYVRALRQAGLRPVLATFPIDGEDAIESLFDGVAGLVLTGGGDVEAVRYGGDPEVTLDVKPARDAFELALLDGAAAKDLPILGLCRGAQLMNVWRGGTLGDLRDDASRYAVHRNAFEGHPVSLEPDSLLARIYGGTRLAEVTAWHGQYVGRPGRGVEVVAHAMDGTPEAIEIDAGVFTVGVQWHAEMPPWDTRQAPLFDAYADAVRARQASVK